MSNIQQTIKEFIDHLKVERGLSDRSVEEYTRAINRFQYITGIEDVSGITEERVKSFRFALNSYGLKKKTQNLYLVVLRSFLKYLTMNKLCAVPADAVRLIKDAEEQKKIELLTAEELEKMLSIPDADEHGARDRAIFELLFSTGMRISELVGLNVADVDLARDEFTIRGKGGKLRLVFLSERARDALANYWRLRKISPAVHGEAPAFVNLTSGDRITVRWIEMMIRAWAAHVGITKRVTPHLIRHQFATDLLNNGADIRVVQEMLGHSSIITTQRYTQVSNNRLRDTHKQFHAGHNTTKPNDTDSGKDVPGENG